MVRPLSNRSWIILCCIVVAVCNAYDVRCPPEQSCSCHPSHSGDVEIYCRTRNDSAFIVNVQPYEYIHTQCYNSPRWDDFHLSSLLAEGDVKSVYYRMCSLPVNNSLGEISARLGATNVEKLVFQSFGNLSGTLNRKHLQDFPKLQILILSGNGLTNLSRDLFADVPNLTWLELRDNNVRLSPGIFDTVPKLEVLELGQNGIEYIPPGIFNTTAKLRLLNLWKNNLTTLEPGTFDNLVSLNSLDLNSNNLSTLPKDIFSNLTKLEALNLFMNNFTTLPEGLLQRNLGLKNVNLYGNKRNMTRLPNGFFSNLPELRAVHLRSNGLTSVSSDLFRGSTELRNVSLARNYIEELPVDLFQDLTKLTILELQFNELTSLPDGIFSHLKSLVKLDLSKNHLTSVSRHLFANLKSLETLDMHQNQLKVIDDASFNSLTNLRVAIFSDNRLTLSTSLSFYHDEYGKKSPFHSCTSLEELYLDKNNITEMYSDWIISNLKLRVLDLKYNQIPYISAEDLQFLSNNIKVDLRHNEIKHIYLNTAEELAKFQDVARDVIIQIEDNPIVCDCDLYDFLRYLEGEMQPSVQNYFHIIPGDLTCQSPSWLSNVAVTNLKSKSIKCQVLQPCPEQCTCWAKRKDKALLVDCSYKNLTSIPSNITAVLDFGLELNFTGNKLTRISPLTELGLNSEKISQLLLSSNNIHDVSVHELPPNIEVLELHNNNISKLDTSVLHFMNNSTSLRTLTLHGNPWSCDCDARDFLNFIQTKVEEIPNSLLIRCTDMTVPMLKMIASDLCPMDTMLIVGVSLTIAIAGLIIGLLAALYYRYQREIKVWLYARQCCLWLVTEDELDKDKQYDAFISYSHKDEEFVVNELVSKLEGGPRPFKLCLHFRDWLAGEWIPTQIARSVEDSRRTIVVLSPNFLESVWGRMEFRAAHSQALSEGRARVILILYGEIGPTADLDPELKAYLSMNTYVKWGDPWFWDKLRYALPHPPELTKNAIIRRKIFEKHQPCIQINGDKKELIYPIGVPGTPPAASTPPADSLKVFICDEKKGEEQQREQYEKLSPQDNNVKIILSSEELAKQKLINKIQCTTV